MNNKEAGFSEYFCRMYNLQALVSVLLSMKCVTRKIRTATEHSRDTLLPRCCEDSQILRHFKYYFSSSRSTII